MTLPVHRNDFMVSPYQIYESHVLGADCVLLIMAALSDDQAQELYGLSYELGMDVLVEVHNQEELERALPLSPELLGVNNRDLKRMVTDLQTSHDLAKLIPDTAIPISESGIHQHTHIEQLQGSGYQTFLVGESLMEQPDIAQATLNLLGKNA